VGEDAVEKVRAAVAQGPLPLHVVRGRTGLDEGALREALDVLARNGEVVRSQGMVARPLPSYVPSEPDPTVDMEAPTVEIGVDPDPTQVMDAAEVWTPRSVQGPDVPLADVPVTRFLVAASWEQVEAAGFEQAADQVLGDVRTSTLSAVLVVPEEEAVVFERTMVTRRRP
jgi:hypothetical protein